MALRNYSEACLWASEQGVLVQPFESWAKPQSNPGSRDRPCILVGHSLWSSPNVCPLCLKFPCFPTNAHLCYYPVLDGTESAGWRAIPHWQGLAHPECAFIGALWGKLVVTLYGSNRYPETKVYGLELYVFNRYGYRDARDSYSFEMRLIREMMEFLKSEYEWHEERIGGGSDWGGGTGSRKRVIGSRKGRGNEGAYGGWWIWWCSLHVDGVFFVSQIFSLREGLS